MDLQQEFLKAAISFEEIGKPIVREVESFSFGTNDECRNLFIEAFKFCDKSIKEFKMKPEYEEVIDWMTDTKGQGLLLAGGVGLGKTIIITGVIPLLFYYKKHKVVKPYSAMNMGEKEKEITSSYFICLDDVGCEAIYNNYGEKKEVFCDIMEHAEQKLKPVFLSTNLTGTDFQRRYGDRVVDRLARLCRQVKITGESMR